MAEVSAERALHLVIDKVVTTVKHVLVGILHLSNYLSHWSECLSCLISCPAYLPLGEDFTFFRLPVLLDRMLPFHHNLPCTCCLVGLLQLSV